MFKVTFFRHEPLLVILGLVFILTFVPLLISAKSTAAVIAGVSIIVAYGAWLFSYVRRTLTSLEKVEISNHE